MDELLRVEGVSKEFPGLKALDEVSLEVESREIVAVIGHNGSGKSTLVKILAGVHSKDAGQVTLARSSDGQGAALHFIHQDLALIPHLTAVENLHLAKGRGAEAFAPNHHSAQRARTIELISRFGQPFDVDVPVMNLTPAQRAIVAIARALDGWSHPRNVIVLDEPTESLHRSEVEVLFAAIRQLAADGAGVIFISHRLDEVLEIADRVVVLRDGRKVADEAVSQLDHGRLVEFITGTTQERIEATKPFRKQGIPVLSVRGLSGGPVSEFHLSLFPREIVGIAGVLGSGREAIPGLLFGASPGSAQSFDFDGFDYSARTPGESIRRGMAYLPGDRSRFGSVRQLNARENITLPQMRNLLNRLGAIRHRLERHETNALVEQFQVRPPRAEQQFGSFSGGNQQKIVLAKWLRNRPSVLLLEEPTQGVDIGAKEAIYQAIEAAADAGTSVLVCSSDAKELLRLCQRVVVLRHGRQVAELSGADLTENELILQSYGLAGTEEGAA